MTIGIDRVNRDIELKSSGVPTAKQIMATFGVVDRRVEAAFASVNSEDYPRRGPWQGRALGTWLCGRPQPKPVYLYDDVVVGILPERNLNNRQPSLHALDGRQRVASAG